MENYIMLDSRKFKIDEKNSMLLRAVVDEENKEKKNPFEKVKTDKETYFYINDWSCVEEDFDGDFDSKPRYNVANYCTDKGLMIQRALHETLNRLLWRFSEINGGDKNEWDGIACHYYITFQDGIGEKKLVVEWTSQWHHQGVVFFSSILAAERAIEEIVKPFMAEHPEFVW